MYQLQCDRCGLVRGPASRARKLRDDAKAVGWTERHRYGAVRDYCCRCSLVIEVRAAARKGR